MLPLIEIAVVAAAVGLGADTSRVRLSSFEPALALAHLDGTAGAPPTTPPLTREQFWQTEQGTPSPPPPAQTTWYGGPAVITDVAASFVSVGAAKIESAPLLAFGVLAYALGPPINHLAHRRPGRALASLGIRALAALAVGGAFYAADDHNCFGDNPNAPDACGLVILAPISVLAGMIIDDAALARF